MSQKWQCECLDGLDPSTVPVNDRDHSNGKDPPEPHDLLEFARAALAAQRFSVLLGTHLTSFGPAGAVLELDVTDDLRQQQGFVHGGVLAYLVDNTIAFAAGAVLGPNVVTSGFTIDYLRPAVGARLRSHAQVVRAGSTQAVMRCEVYAVDGADTGADCEATPCAIGQGQVSTRRDQPSTASSMPPPPGLQTDLSP